MLAGPSTSREVSFCLKLPETAAQAVQETCHRGRCLTPLHNPSPGKAHSLTPSHQQPAHQAKARSILRILRTKDLPQLRGRVAQFIADVHVAAIAVVPHPAPALHHVGIRRHLGLDAFPEDAMVEGPDRWLLLLVDEPKVISLKDTILNTIFYPGTP